MTEPFIYPECPKCGHKSGSYLSHFRLNVFLYECEECGTYSKGRFLIQKDEVKWLDVDITGLSLLIERVWYR